MAANCLLLSSAFLAVVCASTGLLSNRTDNLKAMSELRVPCNTIPRSGCRMKDGTLQVLSPTRLWSLSKSSKTWENYVSPQKLTNAWKIVCANPLFTVLSNGTDALLHRASTRSWINVTQGRHRNSTRAPFVVWCTDDEVHLLDLATGNVVVFFKDGERNLSHSSGLPVSLLKKSHTFTWFLNDHVYLITDKYYNGSVLRNDSILWRASRVSAYRDWNVVARWLPGTAGYPSSLTKSYGWADVGSLWLWRELSSESQLWSFNVTSKVWTKERSNHTTTLGHPVLAWTEDNHGPFLLFSDPTCSSNYSASHVHHVKTAAIAKSNVTSTPNLPTTATIPTKIETTVAPINNGTATNATTALTTATAASRPLATETTSLKTMMTRPDHGQTTASTTELTMTVQNPTLPSASSMSKDDASVSAFPSMNSGQEKWHQRNSGIFGSIIFFGTSITIFSIVGVVWCVRHCVHFPKEALLLRDPPSVRYTAIPDTMA